VRLHHIHVAFVRHIGPYESVPEAIFDELEQWARGHNMASPPAWTGIRHDSPIATPPEQLRFDAVLVVPGPFAPEGRIGHQLLEGGEFALTTHAGPYETLPQAYETIFPRVMNLPKHQLIGLPAVEIYHTAKVTLRYQINHTDICLPVTPSS